MSRIDSLGQPVTGATHTALAAYERALGAFQSWRCGAETHLATAMQEAPNFVMAHVLRAYLLLCSRDPRRVRQARAVLARAACLPTNERERHHIAAIAAALADDYGGARMLLGDLLHLHPRDALALQVAHVFDHIMGDAESMRSRVAGVLPAWSCDMPGYHAVLAMHAFSLEECGEYEQAEEDAHTALALDAHDARAHHVIAHVCEMTDRASEGVRWMMEHALAWGKDTLVATHGWWHVALFHVAQGQFDQALALYDRHIRASDGGELSDLIDAAALLWRIGLAGGDPGAARWSELASAWTPHIDDAFCSFNDLHATLAFVGAQDWDRARHLESALVRSQSQATRHGESTRDVGLPTCRALMAFGRGNFTLAITLLASVPEMAHRLGGSHAQRDVIHLTLREAVERVRRPVRRMRITPVAGHAPAASRLSKSPASSAVLQDRS
ncbi:tetratricopeptide repeat protein [Variovorax sp. J22R133]|uniref:tetratricopeptide repeat protein n=1 Tax=Variovorax brevis TaxID=3053503 RepID=UPI002577E2F1|nr:tetratricopeptide repeat protein [Variovorax sp. J22R133]MDM0110995.1 tetratricopeptide repeat protein [Variovorax sp. J22R133]